MLMKEMITNFDAALIQAVFCVYIDNFGTTDVHSRIIVKLVLINFDMYANA